MIIHEDWQGEKAVKYYQCGRKTEYKADFKVKNKIGDNELYTNHYNLNSQQIM